MNCSVCSSSLLGPFWDHLVPQWKGDHDSYSMVWFFVTLLTVETQKKRVPYRTTLNCTAQWKQSASEEESFMFCHLVRLSNLVLLTSAYITRLARGQVSHMDSFDL